MVNALPSCNTPIFMSAIACAHARSRSQCFYSSIRTCNHAHCLISSKPCLRTMFVYTNACHTQTTTRVTNITLETWLGAYVRARKAASGERPVSHSKVKHESMSHSRKLARKATLVLPAAAASLRASVHVLKTCSFLQNSSIKKNCTVRS